MKKETVFAILLGIGAGVLIALWVIRGAQSDSNSDQLGLEGDITPSISISTSIVEPLLVSKPEDGTLSTTNTVQITGTSKKGSLLVIQTPVGEITEKLETNEFSIEVKLMEGANNILVTSYNQKEIETRPLTIYYVNEE